MFFGVQTFDLFFSSYTKTNGMFDCLENDRHSNSNPCDGDDHTDKLYTKSVETAAYKETFPVCTCTIGEKTNCKSTKSTV